MTPQEQEQEKALALLEEAQRISAFSYYRYIILGDDGYEDFLEPGDAPIHWVNEIFNNMVILSASDPTGVPLTKKINDRLNSKLEKELIGRKKKFNRVVRQSLLHDTMGLGKESCPALLVYDTTEEEANEISEMFFIDFFLLFHMSPTLFIHVVPCPMKPGGLRTLYFSLD